MFRTYDIRSTEISNEDAYKIGWAVASYFNKINYFKTQTTGFVNNKPTIIVARDIRHNSEQLKNELVKGLLKNANVIYIGITTTPVLYFAVQELQATAGIIVTASHNPKEYNGFKIRRFGAPMNEAELSAIKHLTLSATKQFIDNQKDEGDYSGYDIEPIYIHELTQRFKHLHRIETTVAVDGANSVGGKLFCKILHKLNIQYFPINCEYEPDFPNHPPNPSNRNNLIQLQDEVLATNADIGFAFDGDADRIAIVDNIGRTFVEDELIWIVANANLNKYIISIENLIHKLNPNSNQELNNSIVLDIKTSNFLWNTIKKNLNSNVYVHKTGYPNIQRKMIETNAYMGAELSGHFSFAKWGGFDDASYAALSTLNIQQNINTLIAMYPQSHKIDELRIFVPIKQINSILKLVYAQFKKFKNISIDGKRFYDQNQQWWILIRKSNTEPVISIRAEAKAKHILDNLVHTTQQIIYNAIQHN